MLWCGLFCKFIIICLNEFVYLFTLELTVHFHFLIDHNSWVFRNSELLSLNITSVPFSPFLFGNWMKYDWPSCYVSYEPLTSLYCLFYLLFALYWIFFLHSRNRLSPIFQVTCFLFVPDSNSLLNPLNNCQLIYFLG